MKLGKARYDNDFDLGIFFASAEKAKAKFENGLLRIGIPIKKILKGKRVPIE